MANKKNKTKGSKGVKKRPKGKNAQAASQKLTKEAQPFGDVQKGTQRDLLA